jgi:septal ring factor EnvC (AmiA/AmiB activator)
MNRNSLTTLAAIVALFVLAIPSVTYSQPGSRETRRQVRAQIKALDNDIAGLEQVRKATRSTHKPLKPHEKKLIQKILKQMDSRLAQKKRRRAQLLKKMQPRFYYGSPYYYT